MLDRFTEPAKDFSLIGLTTLIFVVVNFSTSDASAMGFA